MNLAQKNLNYSLAFLLKSSIPKLQCQLVVDQLELKCVYLYQVDNNFMEVGFQSFYVFFIKLS